MFDFDMNKEYSIPIDIKLRTLRIRRHPVQVDDSLIVKDCLESDGEISLYRRICLRPTGCSSRPGLNPVYPLYAWEQEQPHPCRPYTDRDSF